MNRRAREFLEIYRHRRFDDQSRWYEGRIEEYERAHDQIITVTGVALFAASAAGLAASADVAGFRAGWGILAAVLSAGATLVGAYDRLIGYEQNTKVYRDARAALGELRGRAPWLSETDITSESAAAFVAAVEAVLQREISQWGQLAAEPPVDPGPQPPIVNTGPGGQNRPSRTGHEIGGAD